MASLAQLRITIPWWDGSIWNHANGSRDQKWPWANLLQLLLRTWIGWPAWKTQFSTLLVCSKPTMAFKCNSNVRALFQFLNTTCMNSSQLPGSTKSVRCNLLDEVCSMYQPTTSQHMSTREQSLPTDNVTENCSDNGSTSSHSSTSTWLQTNIMTKRTLKLPQTTDDHICTTGKREHTTFTTTIDKKNATQWNNVT